VCLGQGSNVLVADSGVLGAGAAHRHPRVGPA
jgi:hypothetical protein